MRRSHLAFYAAVILMTGTVQAAEPIEIELIRGGKHQELSEQVRSQIADRLPKLFATCSTNSRDHPRGFASLNLTTVWKDTLATDHLRVHLPKMIDIRGIAAQQLLLGLGDPRFPGPTLSRQGQDVVALGKCSGADVIGFVCAPDIKAVMPSYYHGLCRYSPNSGRNDAQPSLAADAPHAARR